MLWRDLLHITYCTNVHSGEGLKALHQIIREEVKATVDELPPRISSNQDPFGVGLRIGAEASSELGAHEERLALIKSLESVRGYVFTVNGFPYGDFAAPVVKESVYSPSWCDQERVRYTLSLARALASLPGPRVRSISTVAGRFEPQGYDQLPADVGQQMGAQLGALARGLYELEEETGVCVRVALEPEPATTLERVEDVIQFFEGYVWPAEPSSARYIGLCYDTCHQAVMFEDPTVSWQRLRSAGVPIFKVQLSNALAIKAPSSPVARQSLASFVEPRYLHQVTARRGELVERAVDLPVVLGEGGALTDRYQRWLEASEWRCHFHVPLWWRGVEALGLQTTHEHWRSVARLVATEAIQASSLTQQEREERLPHLEVETYSWGVIPASHRAELGSLHRCVARELEEAWAELSQAE